MSINTDTIQLKILYTYEVVNQENFMGVITNLLVAELIKNGSLPKGYKLPKKNKKKV